MDAEQLYLVADHGYFKGEEILAYEETWGYGVYLEATDIRS
jgi:hypothetical protein